MALKRRCLQTAVTFRLLPGRTNQWCRVWLTRSPTLLPPLPRRGGIVGCRGRAAGQLQDVVGGSRFAGVSFRRGAGEPRVQEARALSSRWRVKHISQAAVIAKK